MIIGILGESCVGKSTVAAELQKSLNAEVYSGKDYLRLDKNEALARERFKELLSRAVNGDVVIYVISEKDQLALLPDGAFRILVTAELATIKSRFSRRMNGNLPKPVELKVRRIDPNLHLKANLRLFLACRHCNICILLRPLAPKISRNLIFQMCAAVYTRRIFMQYNEKAARINQISSTLLTLCLRESTARLIMRNAICA